MRDQNSFQSILIVDDNPNNIEVLGSTLMKEFEVMVATSGMKALDIARSEYPPDLILLDVMMPEMDGFAVCRELKAGVSTSDIPVIFITAKNEIEDETFGLELGAVDYLVKPLNPDIAYTRIKTQLELKKYRDQLELDLRSSKSALSKTQGHFHQLFANSPQSIAFLDSEHKVLDINRRFESLFKVQLNDVKKQEVDSVIVPEDLLAEHRRYIKAMRTGASKQLETIRFTADGKELPVSMFAFPALTETNQQGYFVVYEDISQRKAFQEQLRHQAFHDALTGIPNRILLNERIERSLTRHQRATSFRFALLMIDLDRFKGINDSLGHPAGDELLRTISKRIESSIREIDTVARLGGDEFAVLIEDFKDDEEVITIVERIQQNIEKQVLISGSPIHVTASIGVVIETSHYNKTEDIFRDADLAMYHAKENGRSKYELFDDHMFLKAVQNHQLESELRHALERDQLELTYQPIVSVKNRKLLGFEALIRWNHPDLGYVSPERFIPIAEETGSIIEIGRWVFNEACYQLKVMQKSQPGFNDLTMNINLSVKQFLHPGLVNDIKNTLVQLDLDPRSIKLELTESLLMQHSADAIEKINTLKNLGLRFVIDDFGTGYSSLSYIHQFPVDLIKIDRSFVSNLDEGAENMEIIKTILALSKNLGISVVAEGIENDFQLDLLKQTSCDCAQGYLFSKPIPIDQISNFLSAHYKN